MSKFAVALAISGAVASVVAGFSGIAAFAFIGAGLAIGGVLLRYFLSRVYVQQIGEGDWVLARPAEYVLTIPPYRHLKGNSPSAKFLIATTDGYEEAITDVGVSRSGVVTITVSAPAAGKLEIR